MNLLIGIVARGIPWFILLAGLAMLWHASSFLFDATSSSKWPQIEGRIVRAEIDSQSEFTKGSDPRTRYWPEVEYEYQVADQNYRSDNIRLDGMRSGFHIGDGKKEAEEVLARYPLGATVRVYYDPDDPQRATLEAGASATNVPVLLFAIVCTLLGGWLVFGMLRTNDGLDPKLDKQWGGKERNCPRCAVAFTSIQNKGACPNCGHVFFASDTAKNPTE